MSKTSSGLVWSLDEGTPTMGGLAASGLLVLGLATGRDARQLAG